MHESEIHDAHKLYEWALNIVSLGRMYSKDARHLASRMMRDRILDDNWDDEDEEEVEERNIALLIYNFIKPKDTEE